MKWIGLGSLWRHKIPENTETFTWSVDTLAKDLINLVSLIKKKKNWEETGPGNLSWGRRKAVPLCCLLAYKPNRPSGVGGLRIVLGLLVPLSHSFLFHAQQRGDRERGRWGTWRRVSVNTAGTLCLSLGPDPEQFKTVWPFTEISHPLSKRKFKC